MKKLKKSMGSDFSPVRREYFIMRNSSIAFISTILVFMFVYYTFHLFYTLIYISTKLSFIITTVFVSLYIIMAMCYYRTVFCDVWLPNDIDNVCSNMF